MGFPLLSLTQTVKQEIICLLSVIISTILSFGGTRNHTRDSAKIGDFDCGVSSVISPFGRNDKIKQIKSVLICVFARRIGVIRVQYCRQFLSSFLRRFLLRRNDKLSENIVMKTIALAPIVPKCREEILLFRSRGFGSHKRLK
ncbi:hypothetical protein RC62_2940 [Flavobacterium aquidurense]|uniref:Uncharacterized protein n=1 Tax=Flavobacterium aquidurense TaxID=362413 RepID=A0A0Q0VVC9_9FLAO|nr:hypothetical protein RC62_2940 [Flavobacterium aquidurense]